MTAFSDHLHVCGAGATRALSDVERHLLTLPEIFEADALDGRTVKEQVLGAAVADEAEPLVSDQLDLTLLGAVLVAGCCLAIRFPISLLPIFLVLP